MYIGTLNNPDLTTCEAYLKAWHASGCVYVTGQVEKGKENGTVHLQYFLQYKKPGVRLTALKKHCAKSHFEPIKINNGADDYCNKEDTRVEGPWTFGVRPARLNTKGDLARRNKELEEMGALAALDAGLIAVKNYDQVKKCLNNIKIDRLAKQKTESDNTRGLWIWGPPGVGKSRYARDNFQDIYLKAQNKWFDNYDGQATILLEDHDNGCLGHLLKLWMDHYPVSGETKGGNVALVHRDFVVTSNYTPEQLYEKDGSDMVKAIRRRCKVMEMPETPFTDQQKDDKEKN